MEFVVPPPAPAPVNENGQAGADTPAWMPTEVAIDADYQRIASIPRLFWEEDPNLAWITYTVTNALRKPGPPCNYCNGQWYSVERAAPPCPQCGRPTLKPVQAAAIWWMGEMQGLFASMRVGSGKTLVTLLGPTWFGMKYPGRAKRPGLVVKADLRGKTVDDIREASRWWHVHPAFAYVSTLRKSAFEDQRTLVSYEQVQAKSGGVRLVQGAWDMMMLDEFQNIKSRGTARHKKIKRTWKHFQPVFGALSGSVSTRGFGDFWAPLKWSLGNNAPLPLDLKSFLSWCYALDEKIPDAARLHPGPLVHLTPGVEGRDDWERAQNAFGKRFISTPGVISTTDDVPPFGLEIEFVHVPAPGPVREAISKLRQDWATPDGNEFEHAFELWARERWMSRGGWFCWEPNPPPEWLFARKALHAFIREALKKYSRSVDQPSQVYEAIEAGKIDDSGLLAYWRSVEPMFDENNRAWRWLPAGSYTMIDHAAAWLRENPRHGIVWVVHEPIGSALAATTGLPYFGEGSRDAATGMHIMECRTSCIASIASCGTGKNLQKEFCNLYYLEMPTTGVAMEQSIGRVHRDGQTVADTIRVRIPLMTEGDLRAVGQVRADAERMQRTEQRPVNFVYGTWYGFDLARKQDLL